MHTRYKVNWFPPICECGNPEDTSEYRMFGTLLPAIGRRLVGCNNKSMTKQGAVVAYFQCVNRDLSKGEALFVRIETWRLTAAGYQKQ